MKMDRSTTTVTIRIPTPLRKFTGGAAEVSVCGATAGAALGELTSRHPEVKPTLFGEDGKLRTFVNVFVNQQNIQDVKGLETPLAEGAVVSIIPAVAGGIS